MLVLGSAAVVAALLSAAMTMLGNDDDPEPLRTRIPPPEFTVAPPAQNDSTLRSVRPSDADPVTFGFAVDATINLEVRGSTDVRLRHQDFLAETAPLSARSSDAERADFRFRVRRGLSRPSCVSLEAFSYEGLYLRQTTFVLGIGPRDGTYSDEDATL
ncbi:MAG TPA: AbfB domain-containing protein, partial [Actinoplanes sp.]